MANEHHDRAEELALLRYRVISEAASPRLSPAERGRLARELAARPWVSPDGTERSFSRTSIDRWIAAYAKDGRAGRQWLEEAARLRRAVPARSSTQIVDIIGRAHGVWLSERTVREHLHRLGLSRQALSAAPARAFGRFEAARPNEIWIGDVLHGPFVPCPRVGGSKRAKLFLLVDDYSRLLVHGRWVTEENTRAGQDVLRSAISRRGRPEILYVDNGAPYANHQLSRACAVLGIALVHSKPYAPQGRGKQERLNSYIRSSFIAEVEARGVASFDELNDLFMAWAEQVANARAHAETKQAPAKRFLEGFTPVIPSPSELSEAFRWSLTRRVTKTATVSLLGNRYGVGPELVGRTVELRFDPENMARVDVFDNGVAAGVALPFVICRHVHPAVPQAAPEPPLDAPGVDYLGLVAAAHAEALGEGSISYRLLPGMEAWGHDAEAAP